jgi:fructokinase
MIASAGESLVDFTPILDGAGRLSGFHLHPGGSPYNVAVGVARLGHDAAFVGRLSEDLFGPMLRERLAAAGASLALTTTGPEPTALAFVAADDGEAAYSFRLAGAAAFDLRPADVEPAARAPLEALHFGSLAVALRPSREVVLGLARRLAGRALLAFDPNVRPVAVADWPAYRDTVRECCRLADLVKLSEDDLEALEVADAGRLLEPGGPAAVVLTRGPAGSRVHRRDGVLECPALPCRVVDTVGAGDSYQSALLVSLVEAGAVDRARLLALSGERWREAARFASAAAALTCERAGADPPDRAAVLRRLGG